VSADLVLVVVGMAWGLVADRIAARWPAHEDGSIRNVDWRTAVTILVGGVAAFGLGRLAVSGVSSIGLSFIGLYVVILVLLLATDLDQRLLPDLLTLPLIPYALVGAWFGWGPFVRADGGFVFDVAAAVGIPVLLFLLSIPFGRGAIGLGDLKLLVSVGLVAGFERAIIGLISGAILSAIVILVLIAGRRITLKSYVPYGPFLIIGVLWALLGPVGGAQG
jgi:leader peptidase (prepilin peptidase)/N-methyltransferase